MIVARCKGCGKGFELPDSAAGKRGKCPSCGAAVQIPAEQTPTAAPPSPAPPQPPVPPPTSNEPTAGPSLPPVLTGVAPTVEVTADEVREALAQTKPRGSTVAAMADAALPSFSLRSLLIVFTYCGAAFTFLGTLHKFNADLPHYASLLAMLCLTAWLVVRKFGTQKLWWVLAPLVLWVLRQELVAKLSAA